MAKATRKKAAAEPAFAVPTTIEECDGFIRRYGELQRQRRRIETAMNEDLAKVKARYEIEAAPLGQQVADLARGIEAFCVSWRDALTQGGKTKTYGFGAGEVSWRALPAKVTVKKSMLEQAIEFCRRRFPEFVRVKEEINKEAMLAAPERAMRVPGVSIGSDGESFDIAPFEAALEELPAKEMA